MDKKYVVQVAQTVREQLIATTRMEILMSWGIGQFTPAIQGFAGSEIPCERKTISGRCAYMSERLGLLRGVSSGRYGGGVHQ